MKVFVELMIGATNRSRQRVVMPTVLMASESNRRFQLIQGGAAQAELPRFEAQQDRLLHPRTEAWRARVAERRRHDAASFGPHGPMVPPPNAAA
jgi:hypothetical protein